MTLMCINLTILKIDLRNYTMDRRDCFYIKIKKNINQYTKNLIQWLRSIQLEIYLLPSPIDRIGKLYT